MKDNLDDDDDVQKEESLYSSDDDLSEDLEFERYKINLACIKSKLTINKT